MVITHLSHMTVTCLLLLYYYHYDCQMSVLSLERMLATKINDECVVVQLCVQSSKFDKKNSNKFTDKKKET